MSAEKRKRINKGKEAFALKERMDSRALLFVLAATFIAYSAAFVGDPVWVPAQGPCFHPQFPRPEYTTEEKSAYWQVRFALLVYKGKQWEDSGTTTRYSTMVNHPELDAMAVFIANNECFDNTTLPGPPPACTSCSEGPFTLVSGVTDQFSANILLNANCLFSAPNVFTYNAANYTGNPLSVLSPAAWSPEKWLGDPAMGMFSLNILCASGHTVAEVLENLWNNYRIPMENPRHNWVGIGVNHDTEANLFYITVIMVHMCHPAFANYDTTILPDIYTCSDVYTELQNNTQYEACVEDYLNPEEYGDRNAWLWAGVTSLPNSAPLLFCNGTQSWGGDSVTPMPMFFSEPGYPLICPPNVEWKSMEFTGYGYNTCSGGINSCLNPQDAPQ